MLWCYGSKFLPTVVTVLLWQWLSLYSLCPSHVTPGSECRYVFPNVSSEYAWGGWASKPDTLDAVQHVALLIVVLHFGEFDILLGKFDKLTTSDYSSDHIGELRPSRVQHLAQAALQQLDVVRRVSRCVRAISINSVSIKSPYTNVGYALQDMRADRLLGQRSIQLLEKRGSQSQGFTRQFAILLFYVYSCCFRHQRIHQMARDQVSLS